MSQNKVLLKRKPITQKEEIEELWMHYPCPDGFACLVMYFIWRKWNGRDMEPLIVRELNYKSPLPPARNKRIAIFDFSISKESDMIKLLSESKSLIILDHHKTSEEIAKKYSDNYVFDLGHSGAYLAFKYFFPELKEVPLFIQAIEARDLGNFGSPYARELYSYASRYLKKDCDLWYEAFVDEKEKKFKLPQDEIYEKIKGYGGVVISVEDKAINGIVRNAYYKVHGGILIALCNSANFASEVGYQLLLEHQTVQAVFIWYFSHETLTIECSVRSRQGTNYARIFAEELGGGGHDSASGFTLPQGDKRNRFMFSK